MAKNDLRHHLMHIPLALKYSFQGLKTAASGETAFIQEILVLVAMPVIAWFYGVPGAYLVIIIAGWLMVMALELLNMAIESICNLVSPDFHPLIKVAKDTGSAAVFMAMLANFSYWGYLAYSYW